VVRIRSGVAAAGFLATALAVVGMLTAQAADAPLRHPGGTTRDGRVATSGKSGAPGSAGSTPAPAAPTALPGGSGHGSRVVYSLGRHRVWLVDAQAHVLRTYGVGPGGVAPAVGTHRVFARETGEAVLFASTEGVNVGFSGEPGAPASGSAIRESPADAAALWQHAPTGSLVEVVP
jgi:hypothetical protein